MHTTHQHRVQHQHGTEASLARHFLARATYIQVDLPVAVAVRDLRSLVHHLWVRADEQAKSSRVQILWQARLTRQLAVPLGLKCITCVQKYIRLLCRILI